MKKYVYHPYIYKDFDNIGNYDVFYSLKEALDDMLQKLKNLKYKGKNFYIRNGVKGKYVKATIKNVEKYFERNPDDISVNILEEKKVVSGKINRYQITQKQIIKAKKYVYRPYLFRNENYTGYYYTGDYYVFYSLKEALDDILQKFKDLGYKGRYFYIYNSKEDKYVKATIENVEGHFEIYPDDNSVHILGQGKIIYGKINKYKITQ